VLFAESTLRPALQVAEPIFGDPELSGELGGRSRVAAIEAVSPDKDLPRQLR
jgi:hypothetical protein